MIVAARQFVSRILARHRQARRRVPAVSSVTLRAVLSRTWVARSASHHVLFSPTLVLALSGRTGRVSAGAPPERPFYSRTHRQERWLERIRSGHKRVDAASAGRPAANGDGARADVAAPLVPRAALVPPAPVVFHRGTARSDVEPAHGARRHSEPRSLRVTAPHAPAPAPIDVARVTDQVMRTLERRLDAFRDRHGRI
jgi:hypothetical protein